MTQTPKTNPMGLMPTTSPTATAARSANSCAGVCGTGANGSLPGSLASPKRAARPQPIASTPMQRANGARAIAESLATGDDWPLALVLRVIAALWLVSIVLGLTRGCAA
jgi:hypothetical protein